MPNRKPKVVHVLLERCPHRPLFLNNDPFAQVRQAGWGAQAESIPEIFFAAKLLYHTDFSGGKWRAGDV